jgi:hypothetical protein
MQLFFGFAISRTRDEQRNFLFAILAKLGIGEVFFSAREGHLCRA